MAFIDEGSQGKDTAAKGICTGCWAERIRANGIESQLRTTELLLTEEIKKNLIPTEGNDDDVDEYNKAVPLET